MKNNKLYLALASIAIVVLTVVLVLTFVRPSSTTQSQPIQQTNKDNTTEFAELLSKPKVKVVTSFYPLADFAKQIGGEAIEVFNITPPGVEPHDFEPTPQDIETIYNAKLFIYNGAGLDGWADAIIPELNNRGVKTIKMTDNFVILPPVEVVESADEKDDHAGEAHEDEEFDPHIWTDPVFAQKQVQIITESISNLDPDRKIVYEKYSQNYIKELARLDTDFRSSLSKCSLKEVVTSHNFLQYISKRYDFTFTPIAGISPDSEPSSQRLAEITNLVKSKNIKHIFTESLVSPKLSQTIATETGATLLVLNPIEGLSKDDIESGKNYLSIQRENLQNLQIALNCK
jgi:zinc transport system substrate-binding protein